MVPLVRLLIVVESDELISAPFFDADAELLDVPIHTSYAAAPSTAAHVMVICPLPILTDGTAGVCGVMVKADGVPVAIGLKLLTPAVFFAFIQI